MRSVSAINNKKETMIWLYIALGCMVFAFIYEMFSFGVYSAAMICMGFVPLVLGALPCIMMRTGTNRLWNDGVLCITLGLLLTGVLEIYGTSSIYPVILLCFGTGLVIIGACGCSWERNHQKN